MRDILAVAVIITLLVTMQAVILHIHLDQMQEQLTTEVKNCAEYNTSHSDD